MYKKLFFCLSFFLCIYIAPTFAQDEDSLKTECEENWYDDEDDNNCCWDWDWKWGDDWWRWEKGKPAIELNYGFAEPKHDKLASKLAKAGIVEIKLGYISIGNNDDCVFDFKENYTFASRIATALKSEKAGVDELSSDLYRFGLGRRTGYGYDFGPVRIFLYNENAAVWSKLDMDYYPSGIAVPQNDQVEYVSNDNKIINRFNDEIRFGTLAEGGIRVELARTISLNAGYETAVVFPRYMAWKHLGSLIIEEAGLNVLDNFVDEVFDSSPVAAPIVNFVLKNGFSYAFYSLKKEKMNWPFKTETPLTYETFKLGITFTF